MKKSTLIGTMLAIVFAYSNSANAQTFKVLMPPGYNNIVNQEELPGVSGSQYLDENWTNGQILLMKGDTIESIKLRLNAYTGNMHYKNENTEYSIGAPENIKEIIMGGKVFVFSPYINEGMVTKNYFEVLVAGKHNLLVLHYITKMKATYNKALDTGDKNERLIAAERYFVKNGATIVELDKHGKNLIEIIGDKASKVKEQVEKEDLSYKKKEDLIKIITYLNSLN